MRSSENVHELCLLLKSEIRISKFETKQLTEANLTIAPKIGLLLKSEIRTSKYETKDSYKIRINSFCFSEDGSENVHELCCFLDKGFLLIGRSFSHLDQSEPILAFFRFLAADFDPHDEIFSAECFIGLNVISPDRSRGAHELFPIFFHHHRLGQTLHELAYRFCEKICSFFQVVLFQPFSTPTLLFFVSNFDIRVSDLIIRAANNPSACGVAQTPPSR
jgi:hypothetical protein